MPFVYSSAEQDWDENDEPVPPSVEDFEYLPPPEMGGSPEPVRYEEKTAVPTPPPVAPPSLLSWGLSLLFGTPPRQAPRDLCLMAICCESFRNLGGQRVRCAYDGGNDEGFAWIIALETEHESILVRDLANRLDAVGLSDQLIEAGLLAAPQGSRTRRDQLDDLLHYGLADSWAILLLGEGFGTGEYSMYGAFTVDLKTRTIQDDRQAQPPENGNIDIRR